MPAEYLLPSNVGLLRGLNASVLLGRSGVHSSISSVSALSPWSVYASCQTGFFTTRPVTTWVTKVTKTHDHYRHKWQTSHRHRHNYIRAICLRSPHYTPWALFNLSDFRVMQFSHASMKEASQNCSILPKSPFLNRFLESYHLILSTWLRMQFYLKFSKNLSKTSQMYKQFLDKCTGKSTNWHFLYILSLSLLWPQESNETTETY